MFSRNAVQVKHFMFEEIKEKRQCLESGCFYWQSTKKFGAGGNYLICNKGRC